MYTLPVVRVCLSWVSRACVCVRVRGCCDGQHLVLDHFYNGHAMEVPWSWFALTPNDTLALYVLPLGPQGHGIIYFEQPPAFDPATGIALAQVNRVDVVHSYTLELTVGPL